MKKVLQFISSPTILISLLLPLVLWLLAAVYGMGLSPADAVSSVSFKVFFFVLTVSVFASAVYRFGTKGYADGLIQLGAGLVLLQGVALYGAGFSGKIALGAGEDAPNFSVMEAGLMARPPAIPITFVKMKPGNSQTAVVTINGQERELTQDQTVSWNTYRLKVTAVSRAPLFILRGPEGDELDAGYIKLALQGPEPQFFQFRILPHRFYVSLPGAEEEAWKMVDGSWKRTPPRTKQSDGDPDPRSLHLTVMRGKLTIASRDVKQGEPVKFDGHAITFEQGAPWMELEVTKSSTFSLLYAGLALIIAGIAARIFIRRTA